MEVSWYLHISLLMASRRGQGSRLVHRMVHNQFGSFYTLYQDCTIDPKQGRIQPEVEGGGNSERGRRKHDKKCENFWDVTQENSLVFLMNNALVYMFPRIQNKTPKKVCI